jgi:small subunit ribosomal protein S16
VVVADSRYPRDGRYIEQLGYYDPLTNPATFQINAERLSMWIQRGALPSESVGVMVAKHAPDALRKPLQPAAPEMPALAEVPKPKKKVAKKAAAKKKTVKPAAKSTKGHQKKAKTRAKAKARKASGVAKPKATKKAKKKKS